MSFFKILQKFLLKILRIKIQKMMSQSVYQKLAILDLEDLKLKKLN